MAVAEAAGEFEAGKVHFDEVLKTRGRVRFESKTRTARLLSNWKGCEAAADAIANLERTAKAPKGEGTLQVAYAWLVIAGHHKKCGRSQEAAAFLRNSESAFGANGEASTAFWAQHLRRSAE